MQQGNCSLNVSIKTACSKSISPCSSWPKMVFFSICRLEREIISLKSNPRFTWAALLRSFSCATSNSWVKSSIFIFCSYFSSAYVLFDRNCFIKFSFLSPKSLVVHWWWGVSSGHMTMGNILAKTDLNFSWSIYIVSAIWTYSKGF